MRKLKNEELPRKSVTEFKTADKIPVVVVLDNVRSAYNVGSVFRTADAFMVERICLCGITGKPPHREIRKTALGATESVEWHYFASTQEAIDQLKSENYIITGVEQVENSIDLQKFRPEQDRKYALIFGNEVEGVQQQILDQCDLCVELPQSGTKHSLNVAVSAGIVLWVFYKEH